MGLAMVRDGAASFERRRGERSLRSVRVLVYGHAPGEEPFHEESSTLEIGSCGGLIVLEKEVFVGQKLLLTNIHNLKEHECKVVRFTSKSRQKIVAVEFPSSVPEFWEPDAQPSEQLIDHPLWDPAAPKPLHND